MKIIDFVLVYNLSKKSKPNQCWRTIKENSEKVWSVTFSSVGVQYAWGENQKGISKDFKKLYIVGDTFFPVISHFLSKTHTVLQCQDSVTSLSLCIYVFLTQNTEVLNSHYFPRFKIKLYHQSCQISNVSIQQRRQSLCHRPNSCPIWVPLSTTGSHHYSGHLRTVMLLKC